MELAAARALEAAVEAVDTGCLGRELRSGGDFIGACSAIYAGKRGLGCRGGLGLRYLGDFRGVVEREGLSGVLGGSGGGSELPALLEDLR